MSKQNPFTEKLFQNSLFLIIALSAFIGFYTSVLRSHGLNESALLYIGMPTILAFLMAMTSPSKSAVGGTLKAITLIILISGPLLKEGFICMLMAAPIFYIVGVLAAWPFDYYRKRKAANKLNVMIIPTLLIIMSFEGTSPKLSFERHNIIERSLEIPASVAEIKQRLAQSRSLKKTDSWFLKLFPRPIWVESNGVAVGHTQTVDIRYFKWIFWNEQRGETVFEVIENKPLSIHYKLKKDASYLHHYLTWKETMIEFEPLSTQRTKVTWRIHFSRKLDPVWYVQPMQRYAVGQVAEILMASLVPLDF